MTPEKHAALVTFLMRSVPRLYRVAFMPDATADLVYAECAICPTYAGRRPHGCALELVNMAADLRIRFQDYRALDWPTAIRVLRQLVRIDRRLYLMSIGTRLADGRVIEGEPIASAYPA